MALNAYISQVQRLLHDPSAQFWSTSDLTFYINEARNQIAGEGQCVRVLIPSQGPITSVTVTAGGASYTASPTIAAAGGVGYGATFTPTIVGGAITAIAVSNGGKNYTPPTTITITDPTGSGATATPNQTGVLSTTLNQEVYTFATLNTIAQQTSGVQSILGVITISLSWGTMKPTLRQYSWSDFQAYLRSYSVGLQGYSTVWAQYGQGGNGSVYLWPIPSQSNGMDWDTYCLPIALASDSDPEAIPAPWTDAIKFYAAYLAYANSQRTDDANRMYALFEQYMARSRAQSEPPFIPDFYEAM